MTKKMQVLETLYTAGKKLGILKWWGATIGGRRIPADVLRSLLQDGYIEGAHFWNDVPINIRITDKGMVQVEKFSLRQAVVKRYMTKVADVEDINHYKKSSDVIVATNTSGWSWEYDANTRTAAILASPTGALRLMLVEKHTKTGIGAGTEMELLESRDIGTVNKPALGAVASILAKYAHQRTSAGYGFSRMWRKGTDDQWGTSKYPLRQIIEEYAQTAMPTRTEPSIEDMRATLMQRMKTMSPAEIEQLFSQVVRL
jgi:hypothetical protein